MLKCFSKFAKIANVCFTLDCSVDFVRLIKYKLTCIGMEL